MKEITIDGEVFVKKSDIKSSKETFKVPKGDESNPFMEIGKDYFIRTVTNYFTGRLIWIGEKELVLEDACWIADTGRFNEFVSGKTCKESEPFPKGNAVIVGRGSIIDMTEKIGGLVLEVK